MLLTSVPLSTHTNEKRKHQTHTRNHPYRKRERHTQTGVNKLLESIKRASRQTNSINITCPHVTMLLSAFCFTSRKLTFRNKTANRVYPKPPEDTAGQFNFDEEAEVRTKSRNMPIGQESLISHVHKQLAVRCFVLFVWSSRQQFTSYGPTGNCRNLIFFCRGCTECRSTGKLRVSP